VINSEEDDMFLFLPKDGSFGYFCREVEGNNLDIHSLTLPLVTRQLRLVTLCGKIVDPETREPLDSEVVFARLRDGVEVGRVRTDLAGNYCIELPADEIYSYKAVIPGFIPVGSTIDLLDVSDLNIYAVNLDRLDLDSTQLEAGLPIEVPEDVARAIAITLALPELKRDTFEILNAQRRELGLPTLSPNAILSGIQAPTLDAQPLIIRAAAKQYFVIRNVFFDFDLAILKKESWTEIRTLVEFMNDYPNAIVELVGHTDAYGTDNYNIDLSRRRVQAVKKGVTTLGIDPDRLRIKWVGENSPIASNRTRAGRAFNRRVEFQIIELE
jgi:OOP family OmpA-OmpF porin